MLKIMVIAMGYLGAIMAVPSSEKEVALVWRLAWKKHCSNIVRLLRFDPISFIYDERCRVVEQVQFLCLVHSGIQQNCTSVTRRCSSRPSEPLQCRQVQ